MFWERALRAHPAYREGMLAMAPQAPGMVAWGMMTGVAIVKAGLTVPEALTMTVLVFAGSAQLAVLPLLVAGAPTWVVLSTAFCVNLRFVVFSLHLRDYMMHLPRWRRLVTGYFATDVTYFLLVRRYPHAAQDAQGRLAQQAYLAGNALINWAGWMLPSLAGVLLAPFIPTHWGLGFAGVLCLLAMLCGGLSDRLRRISAVVAGITAVAAYALPFKLNIVLAIATAVAACMMLAAWDRQGQEARA